jgi:hypothetical protein
LDVTKLEGKKKKKTLAPISSNFIIGHIHPPIGKEGEERGRESPKP